MVANGKWLLNYDGWSHKEDIDNKIIYLPMSFRHVAR